MVDCRRDLCLSVEGKKKEIKIANPFVALSFNSQWKKSSGQSATSCVFLTNLTHG